jgi:hypothetical protein
MSVQTVVTPHSSGGQKATNVLNANGGTGYAKGQKTHRDGIVWVSLRDNNLYPPGEHASWDLFS